MWWHPVMGEREKSLLMEVVDANFPNDGEYTDRFAQHIAQITGARYGIAVTSGTTAITLALMACGVSAGDEVIVPDMTFIATANAVRLAGATPIFVDVRLRDFNMDPEVVEDAITERTRAIVPVHVSGRGAPMSAIMAIAKNHKLFVVEDAAEALASRHEGQRLGAIGDLGCFSFSPNKTITTGQGGAVVTSNEELYIRLLMLKDHGRPIRGTGGNDIHESVGFNFKLTNLQAAVGLAQLEDFERRCRHQVDLYRWYQKYWPKDIQAKLMPFDIVNGEIPQWVDTLVLSDRDGLAEKLIQQGIQTRKFWYPIHTQTPYHGARGTFPNSDIIGAGALWLPSALSMTEADVERVCTAVAAWGTG